jgi:hypothetical protein
MGIKPSRSDRSKVTQVGACIACKQWIYSDQKSVRITKPATGLCHEDCVPDGAEVAR